MLARLDEAERQLLEHRSSDGRDEKEVRRGKRKLRRGRE
jgi:hypothetical protein